MNVLKLIFDVLILLFWVRLWSATSREFYFNPFLSGTVRLTDAALQFVRSLLRLPEQAASGVVLLALFAFKTLLVGRLGGAWALSFGAAYAFRPASAGDAWAPHFLFSGLHTASFLLRVWTVHLLVECITARPRASRAREAFAFFCRPFSLLPFALQPAVLALLHVALAAAATRAPSTLAQLAPVQALLPEAGASPFLAGPPAAQLIKTAWLGALSFADGLSLLTRALFVFILGNFGAAILQWRGAALICHESVELLLGRFARNRGATGLGLDFTPLIFFFLADMLYNSVRFGLCSLIQSPLLN